MGSKSCSKMISETLISECISQIGKANWRE